MNVVDLETLVLPLDPYRKSDANMPNTERAVQLLLQRCLVRFGFDYQIPPPPELPAGRRGHERSYGIAQEEIARAWGYHAPREPEGESTDYVEPSGEMVAVINR